MTSPTTTATSAPITLELEFSDITEQMNGTIGRVIGTVTIRQFAKIISALNLDANPRVSPHRPHHRCHHGNHRHHAGALRLQVQGCAPGLHSVHQ
ncbi:MULTISPECIES: hypothetical protein [Corynebacterium]|uniref:hypothetical protein n=1 Tax=Corynebacterium TaxID=1716 RepID=UPI00143BC43E|nr:MULTISPECIES: hypothetical protein [unclassified Corynebacterium]MDK8810278.1 hypothetical protein [Corynebacterium sp. MSK035]MDK8827432.1 hypothetical protein [Corynebacterium sp. MSK012]